METMLHGHSVHYDSGSAKGVQYLHNRSQEEVRVFFDEAQRRGTSVFEDHEGTKYKLTDRAGKWELERL